MDSKKGLKIAIKFLTLAALTGGYTIVRSKRRCSICGSWKSYIEEIDETSNGEIAGLPLDDLYVRTRIRRCVNEHVMSSSRRIK